MRSWLPCLRCAAVCWRCHVLIGRSKGVFCAEKNAKRTEMENKINDESKKKSTRTYYRYLVPGTSPNTWCCTLCGTKKAQDSAPRAADAARYTRARKNATGTYATGAGRSGPRFIGVNIELIGSCAELFALRCAVCLFMSRSERQYVCNLRGTGGGGRHGDRDRTINWRKQNNENTTGT